MSRTLPSATALPSVWNKEMDRFICRCEALGDMDPGDIVRALKRKFHPLLQHFVIEEEAVEKRIAILELQDNDYFKEGMEIAVHRAEAAGFMLPPTDDEISARKDDVGEISEKTSAGPVESDAPSPKMAISMPNPAFNNSAFNNPHNKSPTPAKKPDLPGKENEPTAISPTVHKNTPHGYDYGIKRTAL